MNRYLLLLCLVSSLFLSCADKQNESLAEEAPFSYELEAENQTLYFNVFYPTRELEDWLNRKFDRVIADTYLPRNNNKDSVRLIITKPQTLHLKTVGDSVDVIFPLHIEIIADKEKKSGKIKHRKISGAIELYLNIKPDVNQDWDIISKSAINGHKWTQKPKLEFGNSFINVAFLADYILKKEVNSITKSLDEALEEKVNLKRGITRTWTNIQKPMPIVLTDSAKLYFKIAPKNISGDIKITKTGFMFDLAVDTRTLVGVNPSEVADFIPLPPFKTLKKMRPDSNKLDVLTTIPLSFINHEIVHIVKNYNYENAIMDISISDIKMRGAADKIVLDLSVTGTTEGKVTLVGKPDYNIEKQILSIKELNYSLETNHVVINLLDKKLKENLIQYISEKVVLDLGKYIDNLPDYLNETVNQGRSSEKFHLNFSDIKLESIDYVVNQTDLQILAKCRPKFDISLKRLPVKKKLKIRG
jgi:hypothetical protein